MRRQKEEPRPPRLGVRGVLQSARSGLAYDMSQGTAYFKQVAHPADLRDVQTAVLWEWAVTKGLPLPLCAKVFAKNYRTFWPLCQLGDPLLAQDRMFSVEERDLLFMLRSQENKYGRYGTGSSTDESINSFQHFAVRRVGTSPVWVKNTTVLRAQVEAILRKYGVPHLPSASPGVRMLDFFRERALISKMDHKIEAVSAEDHRGPGGVGASTFGTSLAAEERLLRRTLHTASGSLRSPSRGSLPSLGDSAARVPSPPGTGTSPGSPTSPFGLQPDRPLTPLRPLTSPLGMPLGFARPGTGTPEIAGGMLGSPMRLGSPLRHAASRTARKWGASSPERGRSPHTVTSARALDHTRGGYDHLTQKLVF